MIRPFPRHGSQIVLSTPIFEIRADDAEQPSTGRRGIYYVLQAPAYVNVVALTTDRKLVLVRQWRHGVREIGLEIPAGLVEPGESPLDAAARELREETGYVAGRLALLGAVQPNPAHQDNVSYTVLAEGCRRGEAAPDDGEEIHVELAELDAVGPKILAGEIRSAMVICGIFWWLADRRAIDWKAFGRTGSNE